MIIPSIGPRLEFGGEGGGGPQELEGRWFGTYSDLICRVGTRSECVAFLGESGLPFDSLIRLLNYLLRWVLPFKTPLREFVEMDNKDGARLLAALKAQGIKSNLDLLEAGRAPGGRASLARVAGLEEPVLLALVHRADLSRLAYVRGRTVMHLCGGGYDTLEKLSRADLAELEWAMDAYYRTLGKSSADFNAVIPLAYLRGGARVIPRVIEG